MTLITLSIGNKIHTISWQNKSLVVSWFDCTFIFCRQLGVPQGFFLQKFQSVITYVWLMSQKINPNIVFFLFKFLKLHFEENITININDFVMDFDICSTKNKPPGEKCSVDANYCWTFHFPCYLWAWFLKFLLLNTSNSFFFHLLSKYFSWSQKTQWCQFETKSTISKIEVYNSCCW